VGHSKGLSFSLIAETDKNFKKLKGARAWGGGKIGKMAKVIDGQPLNKKEYR
jgi:hypothetical protein